MGETDHRRTADALQREEVATELLRAVEHHGEVRVLLGAAARALRSGRSLARSLLRGIEGLLGDQLAVDAVLHAALLVLLGREANLAADAGLGRSGAAGGRTRGLGLAGGLGARGLAGGLGGLADRSLVGRLRDHLALRVAVLHALPELLHRVAALGARSLARSLGPALARGAHADLRTLGSGKSAEVRLLHPATEREALLLGAQDLLVLGVNALAVGGRDAASGEGGLRLRNGALEQLALLGLGLALHVGLLEHLAQEGMVGTDAIVAAAHGAMTHHGFLRRTGLDGRETALPSRATRNFRVGGFASARAPRRRPLAGVGAAVGDEDVHEGSSCEHPCGSSDFTLPCSTSTARGRPPRGGC